MKKESLTYQKCIENFLLPLLLVIYPLMKINQGADISDTMYSLANFRFFDVTEGTWMIATYLSNVAGSLLMHLPLGDSVIGMNVYTALFPMATALTVYFCFRKKYGALITFAGEILALSLCWCPTTILYNYFTYLLMTVAIVLLYAALGGQTQIRYRYLVAAGVCLGLNVAVRMPNVVQALLIVAVWYGVYLKTASGPEQTITGDNHRGKENKRKQNTSGVAQLYLRVTGCCLGGYLIGFGIPLLAICIRYGVMAYPHMVQTMFAMTEKATDYKPTAMLTGMFGDYAKGLFYLVFAMAVTVFGLVLFWLERRFNTKKKKGMHFAVVAVYLLAIVVLFRFYWGRGLFTLHYYEYRSVYYPAVLFLLLAIGICVGCLVSKEIGQSDKILSMFLLIQIFVTPLGSNNDLYPILNNMFLTVPFALMGIKILLQKTKATGILCAMLTVLLFVQGIGFHTQFVFQDGVDGAKRDTKITTVPKAEGLVTTGENERLLAELSDCMLEQHLSGRNIILYGDISGVAYLFDMPSAISTYWPSLDSYRVAEFEEDMGKLKERINGGIQEKLPVIVTEAKFAAYLNKDAESMAWYGVDRQEMDSDEKLVGIGQFMEEYQYEQRFGNAQYAVYCVTD